MNAYVFQAALLCEECAKQIATQGPEWSGDSDVYPQGPYPNGGGESDSPQHCDHCGVFLENPLTSDGMEYVRERLTKCMFTQAEGIVWNVWAPFYGIDLSEHPEYVP